MFYITKILYNFLIFGVLFYVLTSGVGFFCCCYICKLIGNYDNFLCVLIHIFWIYV